MFGIGIEIHMGESVIAGNKVSDCDGQGLWLDGPRSSSQGNVVLRCNKTRAGGAITIADSYITSNGDISMDNGLTSGSRSPSGLVNGVEVRPGSTNDITGITITDGIFCDTRGTPYQDYGIYVTDRSGPYKASQVLILSCRLTGNVSAGYSVSTSTGINPTPRYCEGYVTEKTGTASLSSATTAVVSHGLASTPTRIYITPRGNPGAFYWISNLTSTQFTINLASSGTVDFDWQAIMGDY